MKALFSLILLFISFTGFAGTTPQVNALYLFNKLIDCTSEESMLKVMRLHHLKEKEGANGFHSFIHPDGTVYCVKMDTSNPTEEHPIIKISTSKDKKQIEEALLTSGYLKNDNRKGAFLKGQSYMPSSILCEITESPLKKGYILTFTKIFNSSRKR
ncbi:MAG: hypothetical protein J1F16_07500 [Muribaculaceae bacterium]|nr:hypothetical protein [Muribaculaceae bacterium]